MTIDHVFKKIQKIISDSPLILAGTGASMPHGIPGMPQLAKRLQARLSSKYKNDASWVIISSRLDSGIDLESALTQVSPEPNETLLNDITKETWYFITEADIKCFNNLHTSQQILPLSKLFRVLNQSSKHNINIITTNYDRLIEYACDQAKIEIDDRFSGSYSRWHNTTPLKNQNIFNLLKVHGSLDYFKNENGTIYQLSDFVTHGNDDAYLYLVDMNSLTYSYIV